MAKRKAKNVEAFGLTDAMEADRIAQAERIEKEITEALPSVRNGEDELQGRE